MNILEPIFQQYLYQEMTENDDKKRVSGGSTAGSTAGLPISRIVVSETTRGGSSDAINQRISELAVPYGLVVINDSSNQPSKPAFRTPAVSNVIPDDLFDKLLNMVESRTPANHRTPASKRRLPKSRSKTQTKRIRVK